MGFEQKVLTEVTEARANAVAAGAQGAAPSRPQAENALTGTLRSLFAVVENYPELKANQNVLRAPGAADHDREPDLASRRQHYNATVLDYNTAIQTFPAVAHRGPVRLHEARLLRRGARGRERPERGPEPQLIDGRAPRPGHRGTDHGRNHVLRPESREPAELVPAGASSSACCSALLGFAIGYARDGRCRRAGSARPASPWSSASLAVAGDATSRGDKLVLAASSAQGGRRDEDARS